MPIRLVVTITAAPGKGAELAQAYKARCADAMKEPGCEQFEIFQSVANPNRLALLERWADQAALDVHARLNSTRPLLRPELRAGGGQSGLDVLADLADLRPHVPLAHHVAGAVPRQLAGDEDEPAAFHGHHVGIERVAAPARGGERLRLDVLSRDRHVVSFHVARPNGRFLERDRSNKRHVAPPRHTGARGGGAPGCPRGSDRLRRSSGPTPGPRARA